MAENHEKIERTRAYLLASTLPEDTKDGLQDLLDKAGKAANGTPDKLQAIADAMLSMALHEVKQAVRVPEVVIRSAERAAKAEVETHASACASKMPAAGKLGIALQFAKSWPLMLFGCALAFSPHLPAILLAVKGWWSK